MPALIPCGVNLARIKDIGQTAKAWMQLEDVDTRTPYYRVKASLDDSAEVEMIEAGNFALGMDEAGTLLPVIADPDLIFSYDSSLRRAEAFEEEPLETILSKRQVTMGEFPCAFFARELTLQPGEKAEFYELYGQADSKEKLHSIQDSIQGKDYFQHKKEEARALTEDICSRISTKTASPEFDAYCSYDYMDNLLRGGYPILLGKDKVFYTYSRKHGDLERDYNFFSMLPEYYSQGNGNFRDVNQNRRCDVFFSPFVGKENIRKLYGLIQLDGYSPLSIEKQSYRLDGRTSEKLVNMAPGLAPLREGDSFTPGAIYSLLEKNLPEEEVEEVFCEVMDAAEPVINETFGEGYWTDHWTYNLDLVEDFLEVFPEQEHELLYEEDLHCFLSEVNINDRAKRYAETRNGLRQYYALNEQSRRDNREKLVRTNMQQGEILRMSLLEKLALMCATKFAALDAYGMGIEMEGGKPGWYDALNGLPGMFGTSMNEAYELHRMLEFTVRALIKHGRALPVLKETADLIETLDRINKDEYKTIHRFDDSSDEAEIGRDGQMLNFWNRINDVKEDYRNRTYEGINGEKHIYDAQELAAILAGFADTVRSGIHKAEVLGKGNIPAYFAFDVPEYEVNETGITPLRFVPVDTPLFLEGAVRWLKLSEPGEKKREVYHQVKAGDLYDKTLRMYKVNASLSKASYELGRAVAFTPGWLENESVWLHMEYKYLLEILRSGLYEEFFEDFRNAAVPFMDPEVYGRSVLENSSFIVSSVYPDENLHGKGYVARLSGSTVEFISMWKLMMFGPHVLSIRDGDLKFTPQPAVPAYLIDENSMVGATLFGCTRVNYHFDEVKNYIPGTYRIRSMTFNYSNGENITVGGDAAGGAIPNDLRSGTICSVDIHVK